MTDKYNSAHLPQIYFGLELQTQRHIPGGLLSYLNGDAGWRIALKLLGFRS